MICVHAVYAVCVVIVSICLRRFALPAARLAVSTFLRRLALPGQGKGEISIVDSQRLSLAQSFAAHC